MRRLLCLSLLALASLVAVPGAAGAAVIPDEYVVVLEDGTDARAVAAEHGRLAGARVSRTYRAALQGYAAKLPPSAVAKVRADDRVLSVTANHTVELAAQTLATGVNRMDGDLSSTLSGDGGGSVDVGVAVIDTGIDLTHPDLNVQPEGKNCYDPPRNTNDGNGHGTTVAGHIGARDNVFGSVGLAPGARLYAVRAFGDGGYGTFEAIICGIDWVAANAQALGIRAVNMSFGTSATDDKNCGNTDGDPTHKGICAMVAAGVTPVAAAGNGARDFATLSPARFDEVLSVTGIADYDGRPGGLGASTCIRGTDDKYFEAKRGSGTNYATLAEDQVHTIAAPMVCTYSTYMNGTYSTQQWGTSYAAPHATGAVALCVGNGACAGLTPPQVIQKLRADAKAYTDANPSWGFVGDPTRPVTGRYYGYLVRAAGY